jgi:hypothetical protein
LAKKIVPNYVNIKIANTSPAALVTTKKAQITRIKAQFQRNLLCGKLYATRRRGRPKMRWMVDVSIDQRKMGLKEWKDRARNRDAWRHIVEEAKAHLGL